MSDLDDYCCTLYELRTQTEELEERIESHHANAARKAAEAILATPADELSPARRLEHSAEIRRQREVLAKAHRNNTPEYLAAATALRKASNYALGYAPDWVDCQIRPVEMLLRDAGATEFDRTQHAIGFRTKTPLWRFLRGLNEDTENLVRALLVTDADEEYAVVLAPRFLEHALLAPLIRAGIDHLHIRSVPCENRDVARFAAHLAYVDELHDLRAAMPVARDALA